MWSVANSECMMVNKDRHDSAAINAENSLLKAIRGKETAIQRTQNPNEIAWYSGHLRSIEPHPSGRTWAGYCSNYLSIFSLEGNIPWGDNLIQEG
jgi:hypothetical protein